MSKIENILSKDTIILWNKHPVNEYRKFFQRMTGEEKIECGNMDFQTWLFSQAGKTLDEALEEYLNPSGQKDMESFLAERRFNLISAPEKEFIIAFDKAIKIFGYDFGDAIISGNVWSPMVIIYGKTDTKSRPCAARIYIKETGILFRMFLRKVDAHRKYIENAPSHIKESFMKKTRLCTFCWDKCPSRPAAYTIDGNKIQQCQHGAFYFDNPSVEKLPDYVNLFAEFYPVKKVKPV